MSFSVEASPDDPTCDEMSAGVFKDVEEDEEQPKSRKKCFLIAGLLVVVAVIAAAVAIPKAQQQESESRGLCTNQIKDLKDTKLTIVIEGADREITEEEQMEIQQIVVEAYNDVSKQCDDIYERWMYDAWMLEQEVVSTGENSTGLSVEVLTTVSCDDCPEAESFASIYGDAAADVLDVRHRGLYGTINVADVIMEVEKQIVQNNYGSSIKKVDISNKGSGKTIGMSKDYCKSDSDSKHSSSKGSKSNADKPPGSKPPGSKPNPDTKSETGASSKGSKKSRRELGDDDEVKICSKYYSGSSSKGSKSGTGGSSMDHYPSGSYHYGSKSSKKDSKSGHSGSKGSKSGPSGDHYPSGSYHYGSRGSSKGSKSGNSGYYGSKGTKSSSSESKGKGKGSKGSKGSKNGANCPCKAFEHPKFLELLIHGVINFEDPGTCQKVSLDPQFPTEKPTLQGHRELAGLPPLEGYTTEYKVSTFAGFELELFANKDKHEFACRTLVPQDEPSAAPSAQPSVSQAPSVSSAPSAQPSSAPSKQPSLSSAPSAQPSSAPSNQPSVSSAPSAQPSSAPSKQPSLSQAPSVSSAPSTQPSVSQAPSVSSAPSKQPSLSAVPSAGPSEVPSAGPTTGGRRRLEVESYELAAGIDARELAAAGGGLLPTHKPQEALETNEHLTYDEYEACGDILEEFCDAAVECPCFPGFVSQIHVPDFGPTCDLAGHVISRTYDNCAVRFDFALDLEGHTCFAGRTDKAPTDGCTPPALPPIFGLLPEKVGIVHLSTAELVACAAIISSNCPGGAAPNGRLLL